MAWYSSLFKGTLTPPGGHLEDDKRRLIKLMNQGAYRIEYDGSGPDKVVKLDIFTEEKDKDKNSYKKYNMYLLPSTMKRIVDNRNRRRYKIPPCIYYDNNATRKDIDPDKKLKTVLLVSSCGKCNEKDQYSCSEEGRIQCKKPPK